MALTHLLDTSVYCQPLKPVPLAAVQTRWTALGDEALAVSIVCEAELLYGLELKGSPRLNAHYQHLLKDRLRSLVVDAPVALAFARLKSWAKQKGHSASDFDFLIAATAQAHGLVLATLNYRHFQWMEPSAHTNVAMFQRLAARLKANLRDVKRQITQHRRDPAWQFQQHPDHGVLAVEVRLEFENALRQLNLSFSEHDARIRDWADKALRWGDRRSRRMSKPAAKRRSPPGHDEFEF